MGKKFKDEFIIDKYVRDLTRKDVVKWFDKPIWNRQEATILIHGKDPEDYFIQYKAFCDYHSEYTKEELESLLLFNLKGENEVVRTHGFYHFLLCLGRATNHCDLHKGNYSAWLFNSEIKTYLKQIKCEEGLSPQKWINLFYALQYMFCPTVFDEIEKRNWFNRNGAQKLAMEILNEIKKTYSLDDFYELHHKQYVEWDRYQFGKWLSRLDDRPNGVPKINDSGKNHNIN